MTFGEKLTGLRKREGLSQEALAEQLGVSRQAVSRWEQGAALPDAGCWMRNRMGRIGFRRRSSCRERKGPLFTETGPGISPAASSPARVLWVW